MTRLVSFEKFAKIRALHDSTDNPGEKAAARQQLEAIARAEGLSIGQVASEMGAQPFEPARPPGQALPREVYLEVQLYGQVGPFRVVRVVRSDVSLGLTHVAVVSRTEREPHFVGGFPDTEEGIGIADYVGPAVVQALTIAQGAFGGPRDAT
ncbi:hypothetical protein [Methylobacterium nigriterrae]|uniref:hypothetical protein n=1 Tax=Methylobacterium nigriterrae TaxID=3127512 RepID=UPI003013D630